MGKKLAAVVILAILWLIHNSRALESDNGFNPETRDFYFEEISQADSTNHKSNNHSVKPKGIKETVKKETHEDVEDKSEDRNSNPENISFQELKKLLQYVDVIIHSMNIKDSPSFEQYSEDTNVEMPDSQKSKLKTKGKICCKKYKGTDNVSKTETQTSTDGYTKEYYEDESIRNRLLKSSSKIVEDRKNNMNTMPELQVVVNNTEPPAKDQNEMLMSEIFDSKITSKIDPSSNANKDTGEFIDEYIQNSTIIIPEQQAEISNTNFKNTEISSHRKADSEIRYLSKIPTGKIQPQKLNIPEEQAEKSKVGFKDIQIPSHKNTESEIKYLSKSSAVEILPKTFLASHHKSGSTSQISDRKNDNNYFKIAPYDLRQRPITNIQKRIKFNEKLTAKNYPTNDKDAIYNHKPNNVFNTNTQSVISKLSNQRNLNKQTQVDIYPSDGKNKNVIDNYKPTNPQNNQSTQRKENNLNEELKAENHPNDNRNEAAYNNKSSNEFNTKTQSVQSNKPKQTNLNEDLKAEKHQSDYRNEDNEAKQTNKDKKEDPFDDNYKQPNVLKTNTQSIILNLLKQLVLNETSKTGKHQNENRNGGNTNIYKLTNIFNASAQNIQSNQPKQKSLNEESKANDDTSYDRKQDYIDNNKPTNLFNTNTQSAQSNEPKQTKLNKVFKTKNNPKYNEKEDAFDDYKLTEFKTNSKNIISNLPKQATLNRDLETVNYPRNADARYNYNQIKEFNINKQSIQSNPPNQIFLNKESNVENEDDSNKDIDNNKPENIFNINTQNIQSNETKLKKVSKAKNIPNDDRKGDDFDNNKPTNVFNTNTQSVQSTQPKQINLNNVSKAKNITSHNENEDATGSYKSSNIFKTNIQSIISTPLKQSTLNEKSETENYQNYDRSRKGKDFYISPYNSETFDRSTNFDMKRTLPETTMKQFLTGKNNIQGKSSDDSSVDSKRNMSLNGIIHLNPELKSLSQQEFKDTDKLIHQDEVNNSMFNKSVTKNVENRDDSLKGASGRSSKYLNTKIPTEQSSILLTEDPTSKAKENSTISATPENIPEMEISDPNFDYDEDGDYDESYEDNNYEEDKQEMTDDLYSDVVSESSGLSQNSAVQYENNAMKMKAPTNFKYESKTNASIPPEEDNYEENEQKTSDDLYSENKVVNEYSRLSQNSSVQYENNTVKMETPTTFKNDSKTNASIAPKDGNYGEDKQEIPDDLYSDFVNESSRLSQNSSVQYENNAVETPTTVKTESKTNASIAPEDVNYGEDKQETSDDLYSDDKVIKESFRLSQISSVQNENNTMNMETPTTFKYESKTNAFIAPENGNYEEDKQETSDDLYSEDKVINESSRLSQNSSVQYENNAVEMETPTTFKTESKTNASIAPEDGNYEEDKQETSDDLYSDDKVVNESFPLSQISSVQNENNTMKMETPTTFKYGSKANASIAPEDDNYEEDKQETSDDLYSEVVNESSLSSQNSSVQYENNAVKMETPTTFKNKSKTNASTAPNETFNSILEFLYRYSNNSALTGIKELNIRTV